jgi:hypothetical protein
MGNTGTRLYLAGVLTGAGLGLFSLYVLSQAVTITLEQWPRIAVGASGLILLLAGEITRRRLIPASHQDQTV